MSSSKVLVDTLQIITNGTMTGTSAINSIAQKCIGAQKADFTIVWTGTPNGTFVIEVPASFNANGTVSAWATLPVVTNSGGAFTATGSASNHQVNINDLTSSWIRLTYTNSSSTGTLNAWISLKGV